jgi:hypothetical protein
MVNIHAPIARMILQHVAINKFGCLFDVLYCSQIMQYSSPPQRDYMYLFAASSLRLWRSGREQTAVKAVCSVLTPESIMKLFFHLMGRAFLIKKKNLARLSEDGQGSLAVLGNRFFKNIGKYKFHLYTDAYISPRNELMPPRTAIAVYACYLAFGNILAAISFNCSKNPATGLPS